MTRVPDGHFGPDELDALLDGTATRRVRLHLDACGPCARLAETDLHVVRALERLPALEPAPGFADRVMARVTIAQPATGRSKLRLMVWQRPAVWAAAAMVLVGMGVSVAWSLSNPDVLASWGARTLAVLDGWLWLGLRTIAANVTALPWYSTAREFLSSPGRLGLVLAGFTVIYAAGLLALRRLVALPSRPVMPHASA